MRMRAELLKDSKFVPKKCRPVEFRPAGIFTEKKQAEEKNSSACFAYRLDLPRAIYLPQGSASTLPPLTDSFPRR